MRKFKENYAVKLFVKCRQTIRHIQFYIRHARFRIRHRKIHTWHRNNGIRHARNRTRRIHRKTLFTRIALWDSTIRVKVKTFFKQKFSVRLTFFIRNVSLNDVFPTTFDSIQY